jgi:hypothetical protein
MPLLRRRRRRLRALAAAAGCLGPLLPVDALKTALGRAKTGEALVAIVDALGPALDADAIRIVASRGPPAAEALIRALGWLRGSAARPPPGPPPGARAPAPAAPSVAVLRSRGAGIAAEETEREREAVRALARRLQPAAPGGASAVAALGAIGSRGAAAALATALFEVDGELVRAVSVALAALLQIAPERSPASVRGLRRAWMPIVATLLPEVDVKARMAP